MFRNIIKYINENITNQLMTRTSTIIKNKSGEDTGLRGNNDGSLTVDKTVFFERPEVKKLLNEISEKVLAKAAK